MRRQPQTLFLEAYGSYMTVRHTDTDHGIFLFAMSEKMLTIGLQLFDIVILDRPTNISDTKDALLILSRLAQHYIYPLSQ